jgi:hypothetical protein
LDSANGNSAANLQELDDLSILCVEFDLSVAHDDIAPGNIRYLLDTNLIDASNLARLAAPTRAAQSVSPPADAVNRDSPYGGAICLSLDHTAQVRANYPVAGDVDFVYTYGPEILFKTPRRSG